MTISEVVNLIFGFIIGASLGGAIVMFLWIRDRER